MTGKIKVTACILGITSALASVAFGGLGDQTNASTIAGGTSNDCMNIRGLPTCPPPVCGTCQACSVTRDGLTCKAASPTRDVCGAQYKFGSPTYDQLGRGNYNVPAFDSGKPVSSGGCGSCGGGFSLQAATQLPALDWLRIMRTRPLSRIAGSFGSQTFCGYDYQCDFDTTANVIYFYDPVNDIQQSFAKDAGGNWVQGSGGYRYNIYPIEVAADHVTVGYITGWQIRFDLTGYTLGGTRKFGRIASITDRNGNQITFAYSLPVTNTTIAVLRFASVTDAYNRTMQVA